MTDVIAGRGQNMRERKVLDRNAPVAVWKEEDVLDGKQVKAMVVILRTVGCWWAREGGCSMCGYNNESVPDISQDNLRSQLAQVRAKYQGEEMVKLYTSGSFLDPKEIPVDMRREVLSSFPQCRRLLFESRPEFITEENLASLPAGRYAVALGLESADDEILERSIGKGFGREDYLRAARLLRSLGVPVRTYLLLKPPFLTEAQGLADLERSMDFSHDLSESISINPMNVQAGTAVEDMWKRGDYRPPWLWTLVEALRKAPRRTGLRIMSSPSGGGTMRGVHNCGKCDRKVLDAIERFSLSQDPQALDGLDCECKKEWVSVMRWQGSMHTAVDLGRYVTDEMER